jgi:hypothetical protein
VLGRAPFGSQTIEVQNQETREGQKENKHRHNCNGPHAPVDPPQVSGNESGSRKGQKMVREVQQIPGDGLLPRYADVRKQDPQVNPNHHCRNPMDGPIEIGGRRRTSAYRQDTKRQV